MDRVVTSPIDWAAATRPRRGESESGDAYLLKSFPHGVLLAVADGIGHGEVAARAARTALSVVEDHSLEPLPVITRQCHEALRRTRGVVMSLALIDARRDSLDWLGIGNVAGFLFRPGIPPMCETLLLRGGVLGEHLPPPVPYSLQLKPGDRLLVATDGVRWTPGSALQRLDAVKSMADRFLGENATDDDDALVVVVRYCGGRGTACPG